MAVARMDSFHVALEARSPDCRRLRAYEIDVTEDLFCAWLVHMTYGRIGTPGRTKVRSFPTEIEVAAHVGKCLRKRASAPRRIGVAYQVRRLECGKAWYQPDLDEQLRRGFPAVAGSIPDQDLT